MYFIKEYKAKQNDAGSKARIDCEEIFERLKLGKLDLGIGGNKRYRTSFIKRFCVYKKLYNDIIVIQYPYNEKYNIDFNKYLSKFKNKNVKIVALIHDILSLRSNNKIISVREEIDMLKNYDVLISHNKNMTKWLRENGLDNEIVDLEIFDYINEYSEDLDLLESEVIDYKKIYFAGNLDEKKSKFLYSDELMNINFKLNLFGPNYKSNVKSNNITYRGCFSPEELKNEFKEGFGLIWDGSSINMCDGDIGRYLKYNNPHKCSLYLSCGLPIIVWEEAAIANFVKENGIGLTIKSLKDIEDLLCGISKEKYKELKNNVYKVRNNILKGHYLENALIKSEKYCNKYGEK